MNDNEVGYVYIISNPDFKGKYKIGSTTTPTKRLKTLQVSTPSDFKTVMLLETKNYKQLENKLHKELEQYNTNREFFDLNEEQLRNILKTYSDYIVLCDFQKVTDNKSKSMPVKPAWEVLKGLFDKRPILYYERIRREFKQEGYGSRELTLFLKEWDDEGKIIYDVYEKSIKLNTGRTSWISNTEINSLLGRNVYEDK